MSVDVRKLLTMAYPHPAQSLGREFTVQATERFAATAQLVSSIEYLADSWNETEGGFNHSEFRDLAGRLRPKALRWVVSRAAERRTARSITIGRVGASVLLLFPIPRSIRLVADCYLAGSQVVLYPSQHHGSDGSDHASFLAQAAMVVARAGGDRADVTDAALWFLGTQGAFNYGAAGWSKLLGERWRSGEALAGILRTYGYGNRHAWQLTRRYPRLTRVGTWAVVAFESAFPVVLFGAGRRLAPAMVAAAGASHVGIAFVMGLNRFVPAFLAMHPAILYITGPREQHLPSGAVEVRDDAMITVVAVTGMAIAATGVTTAFRRARRVRTPRSDERLFVTGHGTALAYSLTGADDPSRPLVVLCGGLLASSLQWEWVRRALAARYRVLTYERAGSGASGPAPKSGDAIDAAARDLVEVTQAARRDGQRVFLIGHSLGAQVASRAAAQLGPRIDGLVLVEPAHPAERELSENHARTGAKLTGALMHAAVLHTIGLGAMFELPGWARMLPVEVRTAALDHHRAGSTWRTGWREWRAFNGPTAVRGLPSITTPLLVVTAGKTEADDQALADLHRSIPSTAHAQYLTIAGADHLGLIMNANSADALVASIIAFMDESLPVEDEVAHA